MKRNRPIRFVVQFTPCDDQYDLLMQEYLDMGGSEKDLEEAIATSNTASLPSRFCPLCRKDSQQTAGRRGVRVQD